MKIVLLIAISLCLSFNTINAQDITNKLGGADNTVTYDITDSADKVLLRVQGDGKVGIGETTPSEALDVDGNIKVSGTVDGIDVATDVTANTAKVTDDDDGVGSDTLMVTVLRIPVSIDIKPGSFPNAINPSSKGRIPVAILNEGVINPILVDVSSVEFGSGKAKPVHWAFEDIDFDGDLDLIMHFKTRDTGIMQGDVSVTLNADLFDGRQITGTDSIVTRPP